jgi:hypothetical protein
MIETQTHALHRAARRFTDTLWSEDMLMATARIEAIVHAAEAEPVFLVEAALRAAWPSAAGVEPAHEVVWSRETAVGGAQLRLRAFDGEGRLLLRRSYETGPVAAVKP